MNTAFRPLSTVPARAAFLLAGALLLLSGGCAAPQMSTRTAGPEGTPGTWQLVSPDESVEVTLRLGEGTGEPGALAYHVDVGAGAERALAVPFSPLGIARTDADFTQGLRFVSEARGGVENAYTLAHGKRRQARSQARELTLTLANEAEQRVEVVFRAYNEGVAFRYRFPGESSTERTVERERTGFRVPAGAVGWLLPYAKPTKWTPAYENVFRRVQAGTPSPTGAGWGFPALFQVGGEGSGGPWVLFTEAGLDGRYAGTHVALDSSASGALYRTRFPLPGKGNGLGEVEPSSALPWATPWRVIITGTELGDIVESSLVTHVSPPHALDDAGWVQPGKVSWSWWSDSDSPTDPAALRNYIDLAADMGWRYSLIDAGWDALPADTVRALADYAGAKGVGLFYWYNSGGPNNTVAAQTPRDRVFTEKQRQGTFARLERLGAAGIKVDFFHSDKQERIRHYIQIMQDAADYDLMVNFHGSTIPRGWQRTYPNMMTMEAVNGAERYKFSEEYPKIAPAHNTMLPFTRNVLGPMDYTPVTFSDAANAHRTTNGHELALSVVFQSSLQHLADRQGAYRGLPEAPKDFLKQVPASWDGIRFLGGYPGSHAAIARRSGEAWYVGGISGEGEARTVEVDLASFLREGAPYEMTLIRDGADPESFRATRRTVRARATVEAPMLPRGGFVMRLAPTD